MSYDLEIFNGNPDEPEESFGALDCRLAWHTMLELLSHEKTAQDHDELVWFLPTRTVSLYLGHEDDSVQSMAASLVWGDRSQDEMDFSMPPAAGEENPQTREDLTKVFIALQTLAEKLGAQIYDPQREEFIARDEVSRFVEEFDHDDQVRRISEGRNITNPGAEELYLRTLDEDEHLEASKVFSVSPMTACALIIVLGFVFLKFINGGFDSDEPDATPVLTPIGIGAPADVMVTPAEMPHSQISLDADYTLRRTELSNGENVQALTWVIQVDGNTVLERNAQNEMEFRYYNMPAGSTITAYLKAYFNDGYNTVSNVVSFQAPEE